MVFLPKIIKKIREKKSFKKIRLQRKVFIFTFLTLFLLEQLLIPFALAQQTTPIPETPRKPKEIIKHTTLLTESEISNSVPYTGEQHGVKSVIPLMVDDSQSIASANVIIPATVHKLEKENYRPNEEIAVVIENGVHTDYKTELVDGLGTKVAVETEEVVTGDAKVITVTQPSSFRPGRYTIKITDPYGGVSEQNFRWGVLAVNPDKSVYAPNETANLAIAVLDDAGNMVCDAQVELIITHEGKEESLSTDNDRVKVNPECISHDFTLNPDYEATYNVAGAGRYEMRLKAQTKNGAYEITDAFEVRAERPFDVKRISATRIYPPHTYPVTMEITANQDFEGTVTETVPANFAISKPGEETITTTEKVEEAMQKADVAGASTTASESAAVPQITPAPVKPTIQSPENVPTPLPFEQKDVMGYATLNNLVDSASVKAVLGVSIPALSMPFSGPYPVSQEFGQNLVHIHDEELYSQFGMRGHDGTDFAMPVGTPIVTVDDGKVLLAGPGDYGITVVIQHTWGKSYYGHLSAVEVKDGDQITRGTQIARSGNTGITTGPHLHFGIKPNTNDGENGYYGKVDPAYYLGMKAPAGQVLGVSTKVTDETYPAPVNTDVQILTWKLNVKKGEKIKIGYNYLAPRLSPQFYTLGPAVFTDKTGKEIFHEERKWQIAADALEFKFKQGTFTKASSTDCTVPCIQKVSGIGFKPKAIIFEWPNNTAAGFSDHMNMGMGFATASSSAGLISERSVSYCAEDAQATVDTSSRRSDTKIIMFQNNNCATATGVVAEADFVSFDNDGFTLNWTTNNTSSYIIHYTALGGADVSNALVSTFTLTTSAGSQTVAEPGFQPDFVMFLSTDTTANDTNSASGTGGRMNIGFASSPTKEAAVTMWSDDNLADTDSRRQQRTDASIALLTTTGTQDALADLTNFETNGFILNKSDAPGANTPIFYLAIKGGQYDVGAFDQPTTSASQSVYTGFRPSGLMTLAASTSATTAIQTTGAALSVGGGSLGTKEAWCNDTTGTECYAPGAKTTTTTNTDWCNDTTGVTCTRSWTSRKKITINNASSSANLTDFPLLVKLNSSRIDYSKTQNSGQDIRFVDPSDPTVALNHEIESWNEAGDSYVWVKVPQLDAGSKADYIWMYYNNASASDGQNATGVWDSNYAAVYHMKEDPSVTNCATNKEVCDSTSNANNADNTALVAGSQVSGKVNGSIDFNGTTQHLLAPDSSSLDITPNISISAWVKADDVSTWHEIVAKHVTMGNDANFGYQIEDTSKQEFYFKIGAIYYSHLSNTALSAGTWYHVSVSYDQSNVRFYLNGVADGTTARAVALPTNTEALYISNNAATERFNGTLDEIRISNSVRSADWVEAEYRTMTDNMNSFGSEITYGQGTGESQGWSERKKITIDNDASNEDLTDFPLLVKLDSTRIDYSKTQNAGQDIRFVDPNDPGTVLSHEIESWDENGNSYIWVKVPQIDAYSNTDYIWMYYGNPTASDGQDALNVWNSNYSIIHHLSDTGSPYQDATVNNKDGSEATNPPTAFSSGKIYRAQDFDGGNDRYTIASPNLPTGDFTYGIWFNTDNLVSDYIFDVANGTGINEFSLAIDTTVDVHTNGAYRTSTGTSISTGQWYHIVARRSGATIQLYLNGAADGITATDGTALSFSTCSLIVGAQSTSSCSSPTITDFLNARLDELRISNIARSANWIEAEYLSQNDSMNSFGTAEVYGVVGTQTLSQGSIWGNDIDNIPDSNTATSSLTDAIIQFATSPRGTGASRTLAKASLTSLDPTGFTLNWTEADAVSRQVLYWAVGSVNASQDDFRWYKNADSATVSTALEDESQSTIIAKNKPYVRLRTNISVGGNGMNASSQGYKLQYYAQGTESGVGGTTDWCNDTTGVTCTAPLQPGNEVPASTPTDWCNDTTGVTCTSDWSSRRKITFNNASSSANLTDFPVLVKLNASRIDYSKTQNAGQDIRFVDPTDPTVALNHEIESWNEAGDSYVWVKVPTINGRSTVDYIWMYYGNASISDGQNATGAWDSNFRLVQHLEEDPSGSAPQMQDSTSNNFDGTSNGSMVTGDQITGKVNGSLDFDGSDDYINIPDNASLDFGASVDFSWGAWIKTAVANATDAGAIVKWADGGIGVGYFLIVGHPTNAVANCGVNTGSTLAADTITAVNDNQWHYVMCTRSGSTITAYLDGVAVDTVGGAGGSVSNAIDLQLSDNTNGFPGQIDEVRISSGARSEEWIRAEYLTMTDQLNTYGTEFSYAENKQSNTGWGYRKKITFDNSDSNENLTDFPVLVKLDASTIDYSKVQDDGGDIRFVDPADPTTVLNHEIETWNENGTSTIWVKVPQIDSGSSSDYIWLYYGNTTASDGQNGTGVWDSSYVAVYHLKESGNGTSGEYADSTNSNLDGQGGAGTGAQVPTLTATGKIGNAADFDGADDNISLGTNATFNLTTGGTLQAWIRPDSTGEGTFGRIIDKSTDSSGAGGYYMIMGGTTSVDLGINNTSQVNGYSGKVPFSRWTHVTATFNGTNMTVYVNGQQDSTLAATTLPPSTSVATYIGNRSGASDRSFDGMIDEVRFSNSDRSADWIEAEYKTMTDQFTSISNEFPYSTGGTAVAGWKDVADPWCNDASGITCNTSWTYRKRITLDNSSSTTNLTNFPVLVKLDSTRIDYSKTQNSGQDIRFVDPNDPTTVLDHEIESWNESGASYVWVEVPQLDARSPTDAIWLYYGNASASDGQNASGVWDSSFASVYHLKENPGGTAPQMQDSTSNNLDMTSTGTMTSDDTVPGKSDGATAFDGSDDFIYRSDNSLYEPSTDMTMTFWLYMNQTASAKGEDLGLVYKDHSASPWYSYQVLILNDDTLFIDWFNNNGTPVGHAIYSNAPLSANKWYHVTFVKSGSTGKVYLNAADSGTASPTYSGSIFNSDGEFRLGAVSNVDKRLDGTMDEFRLSSTARSADWVRAEYLTSSDQMNTFGAEETQSSSIWKFKNNTSVTNGATISTAVLGSSTTGSQLSYQEANPTTLNPTAIAAGERREFDFSLDASLASPRRTYYFRIVTAEGEPLTNYTRYPSITVGVPHNREMRHGKWSNYKQKQPFTF